MTVVDGSPFFRRRQRTPEPRVLCPLYLDGVGVCELLHLLRHTDLTVTTDAEGRNVMHRKPTPPEAA